jgi:hypothetical protein
VRCRWQRVRRRLSENALRAHRACSHRGRSTEPCPPVVVGRRHSCRIRMHWSRPCRFVASALSDFVGKPGATAVSACAGPGSELRVVLSLAASCTAVRMRGRPQPVAVGSFRRKHSMPCRLAWGPRPSVRRRLRWSRQVAQAKRHQQRSQLATSHVADMRVTCRRGCRCHISDASAS